MQNMNRPRFLLNFDGYGLSIGLFSALPLRLLAKENFATPGMLIIDANSNPYTFYRNQINSNENTSEMSNEAGIVAISMNAFRHPVDLLLGCFTIRYLEHYCAC
jgi:hypothetical protein